MVREIDLSVVDDDRLWKAAGDAWNLHWRGGFRIFYDNAAGNTMEGPRTVVPRLLRGPAW